jgi:hypothetical protein
VRTTRALSFSVAALVGFAVGWRLAGRHLERHKADLFATSRLRRTAALSYLAGQDRPETVQLLRDYISWEPSAPLRRRARRLLRRMRRNLETA